MKKKNAESTPRGPKTAIEDLRPEVDPKAGTAHPGGINVAMGDGSVRFLSTSVSISPADTQKKG